MVPVILVIHLLLAIALVIIILLQRSEGGALGIGGGQNSFMSARGAGNFLTRLTSILAAAFFATSIGLAVLMGGSGGGESVFDGAEEPAAPELPQEPSVPFSE